MPRFLRLPQGVLSEIKVQAGTNGADQQRGGHHSCAGAATAPAAPPAHRPRSRAAEAVPEPETDTAEAGERVSSSPLRCARLPRDQQSGSAPGSGHRIIGPDHQIRDILGFSGKKAPPRHSRLWPPSQPAPLQFRRPRCGQTARASANLLSPRWPPLGIELVPNDRMRSIIAQRMVDSKRTAPTCTPCSRST